MLIWELASGLDITRFPPLSVTIQVGMDGPRALNMPEGAPDVAGNIFRLCTLLDPSARPSAAEVVKMLQSAVSS